jgi:lipopolysaccharide/colanic/teichoic acid biosynthesis glycosyltransferase
MYKNIIKNFFGPLMAFVVLVLALPFLLFIALAIKVCSPKGPVFYSQRRIGLGGKPFNCFKFRTMVPNAEAKLASYLAKNPHFEAEYRQFFKLKNDPRIIKGIGNFLRKTSLDELPQFINVLRGEMSVVGPRPIVNEEIVKYGDSYSTLISVKPGITGLWQVSGRNDISYTQRVALDMEYINNVTLCNDIKICFKTFKVMLLGRGY